MTGYKIVNLKHVIDGFGEERTKAILSEFSCPLNHDVEKFLKEKAIEFTKQGLAETSLVMASYKGRPEIVGYFSLSNKTITVNPSKLNRRMRDRLKRFGRYDDMLKVYCISAPLIGQLGKNYRDGLNKLITGDELLQMACDRLSVIQMELGGRFVYLECEDTRKLREFYERNHFFEFDRRDLDADETDLKGKYLVQLMRYLEGT